MSSMGCRYNLIRQRSGVWMSLRDEDFQEDEIWAVLKDRGTDSSGVVAKSTKHSPVPKPLVSAARMIPRSSSNNDRNGNGNGNYSLNEHRVVQQSAPVNIPEWSNVYKHKPKKSFNNVGGFDSDVDYVIEDGPSYGRDGDEEDYYRIPPHKFVQRRLARSQISNSVFEGVGRTLKGRDLCKVRNTVLIKTGFLESL